MDATGLGLRFGAPIPLRRCPYCGVARPQMLPTWLSAFTEGVNGFPGRIWGAFRCTSCGQIVLAGGHGGHNTQQAYETLHAPDAAAVMAGSAVDAMVKAKGYSDGSLYNRVDQAVADHVLIKEMGDWAHWVRLGSNRPRHADKDSPHISVSEAQQSVEFAQALGEFL